MKEKFFSFLQLVALVALATILFCGIGRCDVLQIRHQLDSMPEFPAEGIEK